MPNHKSDTYMIHVYVYIVNGGSSQTENTNGGPCHRQLLPRRPFWHLADRAVSTAWLRSATTLGLHSQLLQGLEKPSLLSSYGAP